MKKIGIVAMMILSFSSLFAQQEEVRFEKGKPYMGNQELIRDDYEILILKNEEALSYFKRQSTANTFAFIFAIIGGFGIGYGGAGLLLNKSPSYTASNAAIFGGGVAFAATALLLEAAGKRSLKKSIKAYNENNQPVSFQLKSNSNEIGLVAYF